MINSKNKFLPEINSIEAPNDEIFEVIGDSPCPCCGCITIPSKGDANAYICPVCMWETDLFINGENEPSSLNHGQARENFKEFGAVLERLK